MAVGAAARAPQPGRMELRPDLLRVFAIGAVLWGLLVFGNGIDRTLLHIGSYLLPILGICGASPACAPSSRASPSLRRPRRRCSAWPSTRRRWTRRRAAPTRPSRLIVVRCAPWPASWRWRSWADRKRGGRRSGPAGSSELRPRHPPPQVGIDVGVDRGERRPAVDQLLHLPLLDHRVAARGLEVDRGPGRGRRRCAGRRRGTFRQ